MAARIDTKTVLLRQLSRTHRFRAYHFAKSSDRTVWCEQHIWQPGGACSSVPQLVWAHHRSAPGLKDLVLTAGPRLAVSVFTVILSTSAPHTLFKYSIAMFVFQVYLMCFFIALWPHVQWKCFRTNAVSMGKWVKRCMGCRVNVPFFPLCSGVKVTPTKKKCILKKKKTCISHSRV